MATYRCAEHGLLVLTLREYLDDHGKAVPPACAIGIANPVTGNLVAMTNHHRSFSIDALQRELGFERLVVVNDFTALRSHCRCCRPTRCSRWAAGRVTRRRRWR